MNHFFSLPIRLYHKLPATLLIACATALSMPGCGTSDGINYAYVTGEVRLDGEVLSDANVLFIPQRTGDSANVGQPSMGKTDANGRYSLTTPKQVSGAVVGLHKVSISTGVTDPSTNEVIVPEKLAPEYNTRTKLEFEVPASGSQQANFSLTSPTKKR